jgi:hypothetical protein
MSLEQGENAFYARVRARGEGLKNDVLKYATHVFRFECRTQEPGTPPLKQTSKAPSRSFSIIGTVLTQSCPSLLQ